MDRIEQRNGLQTSDAKSFGGTTESLAKRESTSFGSNTDVNGGDNNEVQTDKYGFIEGAQQYTSNA